MSCNDINSRSVCSKRQVPTCRHTHRQRGALLSLLSRCRKKMLTNQRHGPALRTEQQNVWLYRHRDLYLEAQRLLTCLRRTMIHALTYLVVKASRYRKFTSSLEGYCASGRVLDEVAKYVVPSERQETRPATRRHVPEDFTLDRPHCLSSQALISLSINHSTHSLSHLHPCQSPNPDSLSLTIPQPATKVTSPQISALQGPSES